MTVWVAKGLQFPVVYLPFAFNRNVQDPRAGAVPRRAISAACTSAASDSPDFNAVAVLGRRRGRQRRQPADLCGDDARAVAGGRVVGAVVGRTQRRAVAAAAWAAARRGRGARPLRPPDKISDDDAMAAAPGMGGRRRTRHRGVGGRGRSPALPPTRRDRISTRGTSTARSTRRGGGPRTRG